MHTPLGFGVEPRFMVPFLLAGLASLIWALKGARGAIAGTSALFVLSAVVLYPVPGSLTVPSPHTLRAAHLLPIACLIAATGAVAMAKAGTDLLRRVDRRVARHAVTLVLTLTVLASAWELGRWYRHYFTEYSAEVMDRFQYGLTEALAYAREHRGKYDEVWVTAFPERYIADELAEPWLPVTPYIFVLFEAKWSPSDVHQHLEVLHRPPRFNEVRSFERYRFGRPSVDDKSGSSSVVVYTASYPDRSAAYQVSTARTKEGRHILWIHT